jgi:hypothetical protein
VPLVRLEPEVLVEVAVGDLLEGLDLVDRDEVAVHVHELDGDLCNWGGLGVVFGLLIVGFWGCFGVIRWLCMSMNSMATFAIGGGGV